MKKHSSFISIIFILFSSNLTAETELAVIEAKERAQIISELTYKLHTKQNCSATLIWDDSGSGADLDGYFFIPEVKKSEFIIGGHASQKRRSKYHCVTTVSNTDGNPEGTPSLLVAPADWKQVWKDSGSGATRDGSFWQAIPPDDNYKCIGSVSQLGHNVKPALPNYRCVHKSLIDKITTSAIVWSDKGTGADKQVTIFSLPATTSFVAIAASTGKVETYDLKKDATSIPDAKKVEEILAQRMAPIKTELEAESKALQQQKQDEEEKLKEAEKIAAEKAKKQEKILAEKKKQEQAKKALAAKAEKEAKQQAEEELQSQQLKEEQQARIAKAVAEKEAAEKAKQLEKEKVKAKEIKKEKIESKTEQVIKAEETVSVETENIEQKEKTSKSSGASDNESKGLNDILMFFLKIFGMMVAGIIIFMIAFKVLFGKKKTE